MALQVSTKFKERILGPESFANIFDYGRILVYSGSQPPTADIGATGTLLGEITADGLPWAAGGGLLFEQAGPWVSKLRTQPWRYVGIAAGTAGWFRLVGRYADAGVLTYQLPRIDGAISDTLGAGVEMVFAENVVTTTTSFYLQQFLYTIPPILGA